MSSRRAPPTVRHRPVRPLGLAVALCALWLLALALLARWALQPQAGGGRQAAAVLAALVAALGLRAGWRRIATGPVAWDGARWWLRGASGPSAAARPVSLQVWADGGSWLWVRAASADHGGRDAGHWLLLVRSQSPETWGELRRAVYSPARPSDRPQ